MKKWMVAAVLGTLMTFSMPEVSQAQAGRYWAGFGVRQGRTWATFGVRQGRSWASFGIRQGRFWGAPRRW